MERRSSVRAKLVTNFILVIVLVVTGVFGYHIWKTGTELTRISAERQKFFVSGQSANALDLLITEDVSILGALAEEIQTSSPDVAYVAFRDAEGKIVAHTFGGPVPDVLIALGRGDEVVIENAPVEGFGELTNITYPIQTYGKITVGFTKPSLFNLLKEEVLGIAIVYLASIMLAVLISLFVAGRIVTPLNSLIKGIEAVGSGEIVSVPVTSSDELGQIANVFNDTMDRLKDFIQTDEERKQTQENVVRFLGVVSEASRGDLTKEAPVSTGAFGNLADAYNIMIESLSALMADVRKGANEVGRESNRLLDIFRTVTSGSQMQMQKIGHASEGARETARSAEEVSQKAVKAGRSADRMDEAAGRGNEIVAQNIESMKQIDTTIQDINAKMKEFADRVYSIETITQLIAEVTEKTNILAMTAGIEAAAAGDQGKGFLVIANEIKGLADRSATSTKQIDEMVKAIQDEATEITGALNAQVSTIRNQSRLTEEAGAALRDIENTINESKSVIGEISKLAERQRVLNEGVVSSMTEVSDISKQTVGLVQNSATISEGLAGMSEDLLQSVSRFKLRARGPASIPQAVPPESRPASELAMEEEYSGDLG